MIVICIWTALSFSKTDTALMVTTQVATLDKGKIKMPPNVNKIILEIGCSDRDTADNDILPYHPNAFLVSFEPLLDKYSVLLARGTERYHNHTTDMAVPLGHHHKRGVILPVAISPDGGAKTFHVSRVAGCSSLLKLNPDTKWGRFCLKALEERVVDTISIEDAISILPDTMPILHVKLDMQGLDGTVIMKMPREFLNRIESIEFESFNPKCTKLYETQIPCFDIAKFLVENGFTGQCGSRCETTSIFRRR